MKILAVVQRYGGEFSGGSEAHCRVVCEQLVQRGHVVHVVTSTASSHLTWENVLPPGRDECNGVSITRLSVAAQRNLDQWVRYEREFHLASPGPSLADEMRYLVDQGPVLELLGEWFQTNAHEFDVALFFTYLWWPTAIGLPLAHPFVPTVLQPTAHNEPPLYFRAMANLFEHADAFAFGSFEEQALVEKRFHDRTPSVVTGIGFEVPPYQSMPPSSDPYLLYVGRVEEMKGAGEIVAFYDLYRRTHEKVPRLVLAGNGHMEVPKGDGIQALGFVSDEVRGELLRGCAALVQPSFLESFSMVLCEAWAAGRPVIANGRCAVLAGQVERSLGGLVYRDYFDFEAAVDRLMAHPDEATQMGHHGYQYVQQNYNWDSVVNRYLAVFDLAIDRWHSRLANFGLQPQAEVTVPLVS